MILDYAEYSTERASKGIVNFVTTERGSPLFKHDSVCPFCNKKINNVVYRKSQTDYPEWLYGSFDQSEIVVQCPTCGWWEYKYSNRSDAIIDGIRASDIQFSSAILKTYPDNSVDVPIAALREYLLKKPDIIYNIDAHKMEDLVRSVFSDYYPGCTVKPFGKTRDGGKDGLLIDDSGKHHLIQVKRRTKADHTEGVEALRALIGTAVIEDDVKACIFVSTADHFSKPAKDYASKTIERNVVEAFELINCKEFLDILDLSRSELPNHWEKLLQLKG